MSLMWKVLAVMGIGTGAFIIYKMQNPECVKDMKDMFNDMTKCTCDKAKNMMK